MVDQNLCIQNARIAFPNFSGKEGTFNPAGRRNFCVLLDHDQAEQLKDDGWNIKYLRPRDEEEEPQAFMQIGVAFGNYPPKIVLITSKGKTPLGEEDIDILDWADIKTADIIIRPYNWEVGGRSGTKGYVKSMYVTIQEDELEYKYMDVPDSAVNSIVK